MVGKLIDSKRRGAKRKDSHQRSNESGLALRFLRSVASQLRRADIMADWDIEQLKAVNLLRHGVGNVCEKFDGE